MAIAIPQRLMIFEGIPAKYINIKVKSTPTNKLIAVIRVDPKCQRNIARIIVVIISSCVSTLLSVLIAHSISVVLS